MKLQRIEADWQCPVIVAATGPSLTADVAARVSRARWPQKKCKVVAVNDAYRLLPYADILYACDAGWWNVHIEDVRAKFFGERWTTHEGDKPGEVNYKGDQPAEWDIHYVRGRNANRFSTDPGVIHYGGNSGFQAINIALLKGATRVILVGFDMRLVNEQRHFFGDHPNGLCNRGNYDGFIKNFREAAQHVQVPIFNATPGSKLDCFPIVGLDELDNLLHSDGAERYAATG